jgi:hypothetical protein
LTVQTIEVAGREILIRGAADPNRLEGIKIVVGWVKKEAAGRQFEPVMLDISVLRGTIANHDAQVWMVPMHLADNVKTDRVHVPELQSAIFLAAVHGRGAQPAAIRGRDLDQDQDCQPGTYRKDNSAFRLPGAHIQH